MKLFLRIFLSFWLATILMITVVLLAGELFPATFPGDEVRRFSPETVETLLSGAADVYERQGAAVLTADLEKQPSLSHRPLFLFDDSGKLVAGKGKPSRIYEQMANDVLRGGHDELQRFGFRVIFAGQILSKSGHRYICVVPISDLTHRLLRMHAWINLAIAVPPAALVCLLLTLYITRPITGLRAAAQRLADGDLAARSSPHAVIRRDELGDLARDFDTMAAQIQSLMTAQRRFVADVSHELGAPLTRMHLALALLRRQHPVTGAAELQRIERETDKLSNLVQQLLLLAGLEAGRCPAEIRSPVSLRPLCESIVEDASFEATHRNCRITGSWDDVTFTAYPQLLRRAIDNVLRNAIRYTLPGSEVVLRARVQPGARQIAIEILDAGPGVPKSMLTDIFRPFFRTAPGRESETGGAGLGLAIAFEAVRQHGGTIAARNREEGGLLVTIILPLIEPTTEPELQPVSAEA